MVRKANTTHLKPSIEGSLNSNTFCGMRSIRCDGSDQAKKDSIFEASINFMYFNNVKFKNMCI